MRSFSQKRTKEKFFSQLAETIGTKIRKQMIESKKPSPSKQFSIRKINNIKTEPFNPEQDSKIFWANPYKCQKHKWNLSFASKPTFSQKQDLDNYKKYELEKFKQKLKTSLEDNQYSKKIQVQINQSRVKTFRSNLNSSSKEKASSLFHNKQHQAEIMRRILYRKKADASIQKRKIQLDMQFNRWHRQEEKLLKHRNVLLQRQHLKTAE